MWVSTFPWEGHVRTVDLDGTPTSSRPDLLLAVAVRL